MKKNFFKISSLFCTVTVFSLFFNPVCEANTTDRPIVIRKKITTPTEKILENVNRRNTILKQKSSIPEPKSDISILPEDSADKEIAGVNTATSSHFHPLYDPAGKEDPFEPLIKETPKVKSESEEYVHTDPKGPTELEKIDLSQLKLTGIILAASGNKALVREASGRGHVISEGTPIGIHRGRVAGVLKDRVIVKEKMEDLGGRFFFKETELKLNKPNI